MILVFLLSGVAALVVYALTPSLGFSTRLVVAFLVFVIPSVLVTSWLYVVEDKATKDAVTVKQK